MGNAGSLSFFGGGCFKFDPDRADPPRVFSRDVDRPPAPLAAGEASSGDYDRRPAPQIDPTDGGQGGRVDRDGAEEGAIARAEAESRIGLMQPAGFDLAGPVADLEDVEVDVGSAGGEDDVEAQAERYERETEAMERMGTAEARDVFRRRQAGEAGRMRLADLEDAIRDAERRAADVREEKEVCAARRERLEASLARKRDATGDAQTAAEADGRLGKELRGQLGAARRGVDRIRAGVVKASNDGSPATIRQEQQSGGYLDSILESETWSARRMVSALGARGARGAKRIEGMRKEKMASEARRDVLRARLRGVEDERHWVDGENAALAAKVQVGREARERVDEVEAARRVEVLRLHAMRKELAARVPEMGVALEACREGRGAAWTELQATLEEIGESQRGVAAGKAGGGGRGGAEFSIGADVMDVD